MVRQNILHWDWLVYVEMFIAGIAAGAYVTAAMLSVLGRGRSPVARAAHLLAFPLMALAGVLLIVDLDRPERFWHMILQSERVPLPMLKWWSPMSVGSWAVLIFSGFTFVSFVDALIDRGMFGIGPWRQGRTLHGSPLGVLWSLAGGAVAFFIAAYSGVLLTVTRLPGWRESNLIGPLFLATAAATGMAALILIQAVRGQVDTVEVAQLEGANALVIVWQMLLLVAFLLTLGDAARILLTGLSLLAIVGAFVLGGVVPLLLWFVARTGRTRSLIPGASRATSLVVWALLVLVGGFLLRYAIVMGPQHVLG